MISVYEGFIIGFVGGALVQWGHTEIQWLGILGVCVYPVAGLLKLVLA